MIEILRAAVSVDGGVGTAGRVYGDGVGSAGRMSLSDSGCGCRYSIGDGSETNFAGVSHRLEAIGTIRGEGISNRHAGISIDNGVTGGVSGGYVLAGDEGQTN